MLADQIAADQAAVASAQQALDAANAVLAADQAKMDAAQPHLTLLDQIEAELAKVEAGVDHAMTSALDAVKANITPLITQMRNLFLG